MVKLLRPRASRRWDWTSYGCDRQKKGRPLAQHATLATRNTAYFEGGVQIEASEDWSTGTRAKNQRVLHIAEHQLDHRLLWGGLVGWLLDHEREVRYHSTS